FSPRFHGLPDTLGHCADRPFPAPRLGSSGPDQEGGFMTRLHKLLAVAALAAVATPLAAQDRGVILRVMGGGYSHTMNLNTGPDFAHFKMGFALNAGLGVQMNKYA